jgi:AraC family ethanolamine operon transcriptional activator
MTVSPAVQHVRYTEPADLPDATAGVVMQVTPLRHDCFCVDITTIRMGDVVLVYGECSPLALVAAPGPATVVVQFPLDHVETLTLNGRLVPAFGFCLYGPGAHLVRSNTQANTYALLLMPPEVADLHLGGSDGQPAVLPAQFEMRTAAPEDWERMARLVRSAGVIAREHAEILSSEQPRQALRSSLLGLAHDLLLGSQKLVQPSRGRTSHAWRQIVLGADAYLESHLDRPIYTEELCKALGVAPAKLIEAFQGTLGTSPHRYLKLRRLNLVRAVLMRRDQDPPLVKSVALSHGFWHLGQFSHDYREHFGETPSQTLARVGSKPPADASETEAGRPSSGQDTPRDQAAGGTR